MINSLGYFTVEFNIGSYGVPFFVTSQPTKFLK